MMREEHGGEKRGRERRRCHGHTKTTVFQIIAWPWASLSTLAVPNKLSNPSSPLFTSVSKADDISAVVFNVKEVKEV